MFLLREVLVNQQILLDQQKSLVCMIQDLHKQIQGGTSLSVMHPAYFPLRDRQALEALEADLASQPDLRRELVITLGLAGVGGADIRDTVQRVMKMAIQNEMAKGMSWHGMNSKIAFQDLKLKTVVMGSSSLVKGTSAFRHDTLLFHGASKQESSGDGISPRPHILKE
ncbi:hypothetical protein GJAV_G00183740 [Gymnothorax javanicus]|nr:hypothetical protein GJAV_G00183740 [Gymnothorax javanicus]